MICGNCHQQVPDNSQICPFCGAPQQPQNQYQPPQPNYQPPMTPFSTVKYNSYAIAGFVLSLLGISKYSGFLLGTLGIIFSSMALSQIKNNPKISKGRELAIAGLVIGIIALTHSITAWIFLIVRNKEFVFFSFRHLFW